MRVNGEVGEQHFHNSMMGSGKRRSRELQGYDVMRYVIDVLAD